MEKFRELIHLFVTVFLSTFATLIVIPAITDVTMVAVCPGQDECSLAIYLSGFQQAIIGLGTVVMMPLIGNLSDQYGRKALLTLPMTLSIIPSAILAYSRTTSFFYAYYVLRTLTAMICEGSINCLAFAYVADNVLERERTSVFGILSGITAAAFVCGTLAARFLSTALTFQVSVAKNTLKKRASLLAAAYIVGPFQVSAVVAMLAAVYMRIFLQESLPNSENLAQPILKSGQDDHSQDGGDLPRKPMVSKNIPSVQAITSLLRSSVTFSQAAIVAFFNSLSYGGLQASLMYYLKARFHFSKNQYAELMILLGVSGMASQLLFMPFVAPRVAEEKLLAIGLLGGIANALLYSVAWSAWVMLQLIYIFFASFIPDNSSFLLLLELVVPINLIADVIPQLRSIVSKQIGPNEQGKAQGCISGIISLANIISPLVYSPLSALFLSEDAPFNFPGFIFLCIGLSTMIAFFQSILIRAVPPISRVVFQRAPYKKAKNRLWKKFFTLLYA
ncbi:hypothetical protein DKX38_014594 [Salix brachista]|uniref:Major facilitator superfamily (MFS) profile domain-containing protein n=1 Tax=Salix brachista TaxID=2182728 RepID=A0A5N5LG40_9ROSI|nr:hypothetical protein DKX38_014594 [Salix brachista]